MVIGESQQNTIRTVDFTHINFQTMRRLEERSYQDHVKRNKLLVDRGADLGPRIYIALAMVHNNSQISIGASSITT